MELEYFYCPSCGYEDFDVYVAYAEKYANADYGICPNCKEEAFIEVPSSETYADSNGVEVKE